MKAKYLYPNKSHPIKHLTLEKTYKVVRLIYQFKIKENTDPFEYEQTDKITAVVIKNDRKIKWAYTPERFELIDDEPAEQHAGERGG